jgi:hypothetical protein
MMPPQAVHVFRVSVMLTEQFERPTAIIQAEMNREIISALCLSKKGTSQQGRRPRLGSRVHTFLHRTTRDA